MLFFFKEIVKLLLFFSSKFFDYFLLILPGEQKRLGAQWYIIFCRPIRTLVLFSEFFADGVKCQFTELPDCSDVLVEFVVKTLLLAENNMLK